MDTGSLQPVIPIKSVPAAPLPSDPFDRKIVSVNHFQLIGGWRVPAAFQNDWKSLAYTSGGLAVRRGADDKQFIFYLTHHDHLGGPIQELTTAKPQGSPDVNPRHWPLLKEENFLGDLYQPAIEANQGESKPACTGVFWDETTQKLLTTGRSPYAAQPPTGPFFCMTDLTVAANPITEGPFGTTVGAAQEFGGGACRIPGWFADSYLDGKSLALGFGGYCSGQGSTHGPSLLVCSEMLLRNTPALPLLRFAGLGDKDPNRREHRPPDYSNAAEVYSIDPEGPIGYWATDRVIAGPVWIETPTTHGLCYWSLQGCGKLEYGRQSETFGESTQQRFYVYNPRDLQTVASGQHAPHQPRANFSDWTSPVRGSVRGACWNNETQTLFLLHKHVWAFGDEMLPVIAAYKMKDAITVNASTPALPNNTH